MTCAMSHPDCQNYVPKVPELPRSFCTFPVTGCAALRWGYLRKTMPR
jgi:hypothetical protein